MNAPKLERYFLPPKTGSGAREAGGAGGAENAGGRKGAVREEEMEGAEEGAEELEEEEAGEEEEEEEEEVPGRVIRHDFWKPRLGFSVKRGEEDANGNPTVWVSKVKDPDLHSIIFPNDEVCQLANHAVGLRALREEWDEKLLR